MSSVKSCAPNHFSKQKKVHLVPQMYPYNTMPTFLQTTHADDIVWSVVFVRLYNGFRKEGYLLRYLKAVSTWVAF